MVSSVVVSRGVPAWASCWALVALLGCPGGDDSEASAGTTSAAATSLDATTVSGDSTGSTPTTGADSGSADSEPDSSGGSDDADGSTGGPVGGPAGSCGAGGQTGSIVQIELGSPERWYLIGAPATDEPLPLVLAFHGDEGDPFNSTRYIWGSYWEEQSPPFIVVMTKCPGCTSWYMGDTSANADYVWEVLADVATNHNVDVSRIYAIGFSGGSEFLALHGFEFQDVFAGIQWNCGGNAYGPYTQPSRPDCKVAGRVVIAADDFLWDGAQALFARLQTEGHPSEFVEAQCSGHCCDTDDDNVGAWAWFQQQVKCGAEVPGMCGELTDLPPSPSGIDRGLAAAPTASGVRTVSTLTAPPVPDFTAATAELDRLLEVLEASGARDDAATREARFREAMAAYDRMLAAAHRHGPDAKAELAARYPRLRALMAALR